MNGPQNLAREVKLARIGAGFERANAFAESLGLTPKTISNIETAARESYSTLTLLKLDTALGWEVGTANSLLSGEIEAPIPKRPTQQDHDGIRVRINDYDEQLEIEAPDIQINITSEFISLEASYWDRFNWNDISPEELVEAGYRARTEFMTALDEIKVKSLKVSRGYGVAPERKTRADEIREEIIHAEAAEGWTEEDQLEADNSADYQNYLAQADAKLRAVLQGDYTAAARHHEPDPLEGIGEENQDLDK